MEQFTDGDRLASLMSDQYPTVDFKTVSKLVPPPEENQSEFTVSESGTNYVL